MMANMDSHAELTSLLSGLIEDGLTPSQSERLGEILENDAEAQALYRDHLSVHAMLYWRWNQRLSEKHRATTGEAVAESMTADDPASNLLSVSQPPVLPCTVPLPAAPAQGPQFLSTGFHNTGGYFASTGWPVAYLVTTVIFAVGLAAAALVHVSSPAEIVRHSPNRSFPSPLPSQSNAIARITGMVDCVWTGDGAKNSLLSSLSSPLVALGDRLALSSGLLEITYNSGAKVVLEGPVSYEVESSAGGFLCLGKLTAKLEQKSEIRGQKSEIRGPRSEPENQKSEITNQKFVVRTPTATVTDIGTEFGVEVTQSGDTSTHVFRGVVEVQPIAAGRVPQGRAIRLGESDSVQIEKRTKGPDVQVRRVAVDSAAFVRVSQLPKVAEQRRLGPFRRWQEASERLSQDPSLVAYYNFQQRSDGYLGLLRNSAAGGDASRDGSIGNASWTVGRMPGKQALRFSGPNDYVRIDLPQKISDLTMAAWVCIDALKNEYGALLTGDAVAIGQVAWEVGTDRQVCFHVIGGSDVAYRSGPVFGPSYIGRWTHLAAVWDHAALRVRLYLDGEMTDEKEIQKPIPICIGPSMIGHWSPGVGDTTGKARNLHGRIDELAIFSRPLSSEEIRQLFSAGLPEQGVQGVKKQEEP
jgi:hypothetical protein